MKNLASLYQYLDSLFDKNVDDDTLFASSYIRGFLSLSAADFGDDQQNISAELLDTVSKHISKAKSELSPQDAAIVSNFWLTMQQEVLKEK